MMAVMTRARWLTIAVVFVVLAMPLAEGLGSGSLIDRKHRHARTHKRSGAGGTAEGPLFDAVADAGKRGVEVVAHALGFKGYQFGDLTKKFAQWGSEFAAYLKSMDRKRKMREYWSFLGKPHSAGIYTFVMPDFLKDYSLDEWAVIANGAMGTKRSPIGSQNGTDAPATKPGSPPRSLIEADAVVGDPEPVLAPVTAANGTPIAAAAVPPAPAPAATPLPEEYNFFTAYPACVRDGLDQSRCGSCWAFAATTMLTHRVCRAVEVARRTDQTLMPVPEKWFLGAQSLCSCCGPMVCASGACKGGHVFMALMWADTNPLWAGDCAKYESWTGDSEQGLCPKFKDMCKKDKIGFFGSKRSPVSKLAFSIDNAKYLFPQSRDSVEHLMREVLDNGPVVITIRTATSFMGYEGRGVFAAGKAADALGVGVHTSHAMVLVGWGTETIDNQKVPYWLVENSWGNKYRRMPDGYRHMVRIIRGVDDMGLETAGSEAATPRIRTPDGKEVPIDQGWPRQ